MRFGRPRIAVTSGLAVVVVAAIVALIVAGTAGTSSNAGLASNPYLDPGTPLSRPAPDFTLTDQFGHPVSLRSFHGKVVVLAFNDSECTTICPLTTTAMLDAKAMLGRAGRSVQLLGIDANPTATAVKDVFSYSELHGMLHAWQFLTAPRPQLERVWKAYGIDVAINAGQIDHTPALFVIGPNGHLARLYVTQQSYAAVGQLGQVVAQEISTLLPARPPVNSRLSYTRIKGIAPRPGPPRLYLFFATWDQEVTSLRAGLEGLAHYDAFARTHGLPRVEAIDETSVEPPGALQRFETTWRSPLPYAIASDRDGRLGDGYEVQDLPWLMVTSSSGQIAWYYDVSTLGWPTEAKLVARVKEALARAAGPPANAKAALAGSPPLLAGLHDQSSQLLGSEPALAARIRALKGYPIVLNVWASWCPPCKAEFGLFASASTRYGRQVAFLGADTDDTSGDARAFLAAHLVSYPSYQASRTNLPSIVPGGVIGYPTTVFIGRTGKVAYVHTGQYVSQGTLDGDIASYAFGG